MVIMKSFSLPKSAAIVSTALLSCSFTFGQYKPTEDDYYRMVNIPIPSDITLEVGGLDWLDEKKTRLAVCTRRGELWVLDNVYAETPAIVGQQVEKVDEDGKKFKAEPTTDDLVGYKQMLFGMHEALGMVVNPPGYPDGIYMAQRGELTRCVDEDGDDRIDLVEAFSSGWEISGSYHEYAFGPKIGKDGMLWVTLNRPFGGGQEAEAYWRGWAVKIDPKGEVHRVCLGLRSPAGLGTNSDQEMFFTDNQGDHVPVCKLSHLKPGSFHGQTISLNTVQDLPEAKAVFELPFQGYPKRSILYGEAVPANPKLQTAAVWFPYPGYGKSHTDIFTIDQKGKFGPFDGQLLVGDLSTAQVLRVVLEKIDGDYQGAVIKFRQRFVPPALRMAWGKPGTLFVGGASRGWGGGARPYGLQRVEWTGKTPFEVHEMRAKPDGFELTFTLPVDPKTAGDPKSYNMKSWTYNYHSGYGDKPREEQELKVTSAKVGKDNKSVYLKIDGLRPYFLHELNLPGVKSAEGLPVLHPQAVYTLNKIPKN